MISFLEFIEHQRKLPIIETVFGSDSISESNIPEVRGSRHFTTHQQIEPHSNDEADSIHEQNKYQEGDREENKHVASYTNESTMLNGFLKEHYCDPSKSVRPRDWGFHQSHLAYLDDALNRHQTGSDFHVYAGVAKSPLEYFKNSNANGKFVGHLPHYTSTSTSYNEAKHFANNSKSQPENIANANEGVYPEENGEYKNVLKIHVPKGTNAMSMRDISKHPEEDEVLLHRGHNIEVHPHPTFDEANKTFVWHSKIVGHDPERVYE